MILPLTLSWFTCRTSYPMSNFSQKISSEAGRVVTSLSTERLGIKLEQKLQLAAGSVSSLDAKVAFDCQRLKSWGDVPWPERREPKSCVFRHSTKLLDSSEIRSSQMWRRQPSFSLQNFSRRWCKSFAVNMSSCCSISDWRKLRDHSHLAFLLNRSKYCTILGLIFCCTRDVHKGVSQQPKSFLQNWCSKVYAWGISYTKAVVLECKFAGSSGA